MSGSGWPTDACRSQLRGYFPGTSAAAAAAAAAHDPDFVEHSDFPEQSSAAPGAPPLAQPGLGPGISLDFWDVQVNTDKLNRSLGTVTPHRDSPERRSLPAGIRYGDRCADLGSAVLNSPGPRVARPHRAVDGSPSSSLSSPPLAGDLVRPCSTEDYQIGRAVAAMADNRLDDYHNFLCYLAAVEAGDRASKYHMDTVDTTRHADDDCGGFVPRPFHPETAWFRSHNDQDLFADGEDEPDNVLGRSLFFCHLSLSLSHYFTLSIDRKSVV